MAAPPDISRLVADWIVTLIEEGIEAERFSAATVNRCNSVAIARESFPVDSIAIYVTPIEIDPLTLRAMGLTEEHTLSYVSIGKRVTNPTDNAQSDPILDQVGAIYRWFVNNTDHKLEDGTTRRLDVENSELGVLLEDALLHEKNLAVGGFQLVFVEDRETEEEYS